MGTQQQFCLRWNNHQSNMLSVFDDLFQNEALVDVTLACDGLSIKAHKMVLSACSPYFQSLFLDNPCKHPIVILKDIRFSDLKALMDFMYKGEVNVSQEQLSTLLKTAETLKVRGLTEVAGGSELHNSLLAQPNLAQQHQQQTTQSPQLPRSSIPSAPPLPQQTQPPQPAPSSPSPKRKKVRHRHKSDRSSSQSDHDDSDSHELIEPKVEITEDSVDDERLGDHGAKVMRLSSGRTGTGTGSISGVTNDFTTNTSQGVSSSQETNSTTESQGFPGRSGNVVNLNTPPLLFNPPGPPATVQSMAPVQSIGQPPVLQGSSQALPPPAPLPILMSGSSMMNIHNAPSTSRQDSESQKIPERLKPRPCKVCNKVISNARNMLKHMLVHDPVKIPFRCTLCQCEYSREETLRWHLKAKHGVHPPRNTSRNMSHPLLQQYHHYYHAVSHRITGRDNNTSELYSERIFSSNPCTQTTD